MRPMASRWICEIRTWSKASPLCRAWTHIIARFSATRSTRPIGSSRRTALRLMEGLLDRDLGHQRAAEVALGLLEAVLRVARDACRPELHRVVAHDGVAAALDHRVERAG